jgi:hypothetical protein
MKQLALKHQVFALTISSIFLLSSCAITKPDYGEFKIHPVDRGAPLAVFHNNTYEADIANIKNSIRKSLNTDAYKIYEQIYVETMILP